MRTVAVLGGLVAVALVASYLTWTAEDGPPDDADIVVLRQTTDDLRRIRWEEDDKTVSLAVANDGRGDYAWFEVDLTKTVDPPEPEPTDETDADAEAEAEAPAPPPAEPVTETERLAFRGASGAVDVWEGFAPLYAMRKVPVQDEEALATYGLDDPEARLVVQRAQGDVTLEVGSEAYGTRDRYVLHEGAVYLLSDKLLRPLQFANTRLVERDLWPYDAATAEKVVAKRAGAAGPEQRVLVQQNTDDREAAYWSDAERPETKDIEGATWLTKLFRLRVREYHDAGELQALGEADFLVDVEVSGDDGTWNAQLFTLGDDERIFAQSTYLRGTVELTQSLAEEAVADLDPLFDGVPAEAAEDDEADEEPEDEGDAEAE